VATAAFALVLTSPVSFAQAPAPGAAQGGAQPAAQKNWKDRAEYDLYAQIIKTADPKQRLELLNTWKDKYAQSDYADDRDQFFVATYGQLAGSDPTARQKVLDTAKQVLAKNPKHFQSLYFTVIWGPVVGINSPSPDLQSQVDSAAHGLLDGGIDTQFDAKNKPPAMNDADWTKAKNQVTAIAHNALAWEATTKKDNATAENEYKASLTANPESGTIPYSYAQLLQADKKYQEALFQYARAAQYDGPGAIQASKRPDVLSYFNKVYAQFHGSADGADKVLAAAKTSALPPPDFKIEGQGDIEAAKAAETNKRLESDPAFKLWYTIKTNLQGDQGESFFNSNVKDAEIPGKAVANVNTFSGTVISADPPEKPTKITLAVEDPTKADATLVFTDPLNATTPIKPGDKLEFAGVGDSFTKDPYMLTFKDPELPGVKTSTPKKPAPVHRRRPAAK
jgi:hypothetical protein